MSASSSTDAPIPRSPSRTYTLIWITLGVYYVYWIVRMMREVNFLRSSEVFPVHRIVQGGVAYSIVYFILMGGIARSIWSYNALLFHLAFGLILVLGVMAVGWIVGVAYLHARIGKSIGELQAERGLPDPATPRRSVFLFFAYFTVVPYLQKRMNSLIA